MMNRDSRMILTILVLLCAVPLAADSPPEVVETTFEVQGMHCDGCSSAIVATLEKIDGVTEATADHEAGVAQAVYRPRKIDVEDLKTAIEKLGYTVSAMKTETVES
jgi:copper chaperone